MLEALLAHNLPAIQAREVAAIGDAASELHVSHGEHCSLSATQAVDGNIITAERKFKGKPLRKWTFVTLFSDRLFPCKPRALAKRAKCTK